jgi:hypothetical protein
MILDRELAENKTLKCRTPFCERAFQNFTDREKTEKIFSKKSLLLMQHLYLCGVK